MPPAKPPAAYLRLSVADPKSTSIAGQLRIVRRECRQRGWPAPVIFDDPGISGSKDVRRPARDDLERRLAAGEFSALIVKSVDRLARSTADFHRIVKVARKAGCALVVTDLGLDSDTPVGEMVLGILAQIAAFEVAMTGARVKVSNEQRIRAGRALGGPVPFGLKNVAKADQPGTYRVIDEDEAAIVRRIAQEVLEGHSLRAIARRLHLDNVPTPRGTAALPWNSTTVRRVIANPAVAGMERRLGDLVRDEATGLPRVNLECAILDTETFRAVESTLSARSATAKPRTPHAERLLLDGIAECAGCGYRMRRAMTRAGRQNTFYSYTCSSRGRNICPAPAFVSQRLLDEHVEAEFLASFGRFKVTELVEVDDPLKLAKLADARAQAESTALALGKAAPGEIPKLAERLIKLRQTETGLLADLDSAPRYERVETGRTFAEEFHSTYEDHAARRALLARAVRVVVRRSSSRGESVAARVEILPRHDDGDIDPD